MAGRFLSIEEAARQLGVDVDEVNRLVDRKKLFPMRDGTTLKFKADEVERVAGQLGEESSRFDNLSLDLDQSGSALSGAAGSGLGAPALSGIAADDIVLGDPLAIDMDDGSIFADAPPAAGPSASHTIAPGEAAASGGVSGLSMPSLGGSADISGADVLFDDSASESADSEELALESIAGASSPSLVGRSLPLDEGTVAIDLGGSAALPQDASGGSFAVGSDAGLGKGPASTGAGAALSGVLDSGLSLEDGDAVLSGLGASGIDLGAASGIGGAASNISGAGADGATMLGGDDFELGGLGGDEESASVVIAAEDTGDSSFFSETMAGAGSSFSDESGAAPSLASASEAIDYPHELAFDIRFSVWQICGLVCCALVLLAGGFVALDLVRTIGSAAGSSPANALVEGMASAFGWR